MKLSEIARGEWKPSGLGFDLDYFLLADEIESLKNDLVKLQFLVYLLWLNHRCE